MDSYYDSDSEDQRICHVCDQPTRNHVCSTCKKTHYYCAGCQSAHSREEPYIRVMQKERYCVENLDNGFYAEFGKGMLVKLARSSDAAKHFEAVCTLTAEEVAVAVFSFWPKRKRTAEPDNADEPPAKKVCLAGAHTNDNVNKD